MICYFDTSAFVPLLIDEAGSPRASELWKQSEHVVSCPLIYVETAAAFASAHRLGRLDEQAHETALKSLDELYEELDLVTIHDELIHRAAFLSHQVSLRGYDAMHCAAAELLATPDFVVASGDSQLLRACSELGMATADTNS